MFRDSSLYPGFFERCFRDPIRVPRIKENYHRTPRIKENRVPRIREIESLQVHTGYLTVSLKKTWLDQKCLSRLTEYDDVIRGPPFLVLPAGHPNLKPTTGYVARNVHYLLFRTTFFVPTKFSIPNGSVTARRWRHMQINGHREMVPMSNKSLW